MSRPFLYVLHYSIATKASIGICKFLEQQLIKRSLVIPNNYLYKRWGEERLYSTVETPAPIAVESPQPCCWYCKFYIESFAGRGLATKSGTNVEHCCWMRRQKLLSIIFPCNFTRHCSVLTSQRNAFIKPVCIPISVKRKN